MRWLVVLFLLALGCPSDDGGGFGSGDDDDATADDDDDATGDDDDSDSLYEEISPLGTISVYVSGATEGDDDDSVLDPCVTDERDDEERHLGVPLYGIEVQEYGTDNVESTDVSGVATLTMQSLDPAQLYIAGVDPYFPQLVAVTAESYAYGGEQIGMELDDYDPYQDGFGFDADPAKGTVALIFRAPLDQGADAIAGVTAGIDLGNGGVFACDRHREGCVADDTLPAEPPPPIPPDCPMDTIAFANTDPGSAAITWTEPPGITCHGPSSVDVVAGVTSFVYFGCVGD